MSISEVFLNSPFTCSPLKETKKSFSALSHQPPYKSFTIPPCCWQTVVAASPGVKGPQNPSEGNNGGVLSHLSPKKEAKKSRVMLVKLMSWWLFMSSSQSRDSFWRSTLFLFFLATSPLVSKAKHQTHRCLLFQILQAIQKKVKIVREQISGEDKKNHVGSSRITQKSGRKHCKVCGNDWVDHDMPEMAIDDLPHPTTAVFSIRLGSNSWGWLLASCFGFLRFFVGMLEDSESKPFLGQQNPSSRIEGRPHSTLRRGCSLSSRGFGKACCSAYSPNKTCP